MYEHPKEPPADTQIGQAARLVAEVFGCSVAEADRVLTLGINARIAEQNERRTEEPEEREE
jgi:hypothetical protein